MQEYELILVGSRNPIFEVIIFAFLFGIIASIVLITQGARRIPVQYAKRQVGKRVFGGTTQFIPLRVNTAGVMPIIFAQSLMFIPNTIASFFPGVPAMQAFAQWFNPAEYGYAFVYGIMVVFFTFFYTAIIFNPKDIADNMKRQGGFVPGIRPGQPTAEYIERILTRITLPGSIFLALIAILPVFAYQAGIKQQFALFYGGTSLLILVGVMLDTLQQIESHLLMRHYDGLTKSGRIKGRSSTFSV